MEQGLVSADHGEQRYVSRARFIAAAGLHRDGVVVVAGWIGAGTVDVVAGGKDRDVGVRRIAPSFPHATVVGTETATTIDTGNLHGTKPGVVCMRLLVDSVVVRTSACSKRPVGM